MKILFALASPIIRPNGIVTFILNAQQMLAQHNITCDFVTDNPVNLQGFNQIFYPQDTQNYANTAPPAIEFSWEICARIQAAYQQTNKDYDLVISNDAQSTQAFLDLNVPRIIHYVHTAALVEHKAAYLTPAYIEKERELMKKVQVAAAHENILKHLNIPGLVMHMPLNNWKDYLPQTQQQGLMFVGEGTTRKGAQDFIKVAAATPAKKLIISSAEPEVSFETLTNYQLKRFAVDDPQKPKFIAQAQVGFHPSCSDVWPYAAQEMMFSKPVFVLEEYSWARMFADSGAKLTNKHNMIKDIIRELENPRYNNQQQIEYTQTAAKTWLANI